MTDFLLSALPAIRISSLPDSTAPTRASPKTTQKRKPGRAETRHSPVLQPVYRILRNANSFVQSWRDGFSPAEREYHRSVEEKKQILSLRMTEASTMRAWEEAARELDCLEGNDAWKLDPASSDYNAVLVAKRMAELDSARIACDVPAMLHLVRTALSRNLGGIGNINLYRHSHIGTKRLIEKYVDATTKAIEALVEQSAISGALPDGVDQRDILDALLCARQSFGRSALLLSGGATFGMSHIGVLKAMYEADLLPRIISGASAGSIVCSVLCTHTDEEIPEVLRTFPHGALDVFEEQGHEDTLADHLKRLLTEGSWSDIRHLTRVMRGILGDITFQEAYNRTRRICNICVSSASIYELPRLLNYVTAPNVMVWSAVAASCSVPLVFNAGLLLVKDPATGEHIPWNPTPHRWIDGSVDNDLPMTRLAEMFNVNHFIVSQVNPHVVPFLTREDRLYAVNDRLPDQSQPPQGEADWTYTLSALAKEEALHRLHFLAELGIMPNLVTKLQSILSQKYSGHINILPQIDPQDLPRIIQNPTADFMLRACLTGERAAWPKLSRIRYRCATELALDRAVHALRARVVFSRSQVNLRRLATGSDELGYLSGRATMPRRANAPSTGHHPDIIQGPGRGSRRRSSGSNLHLLEHHRNLLEKLEGVITDDETEEEERLEMSFRMGELGIHPTSRGGAGKPRLKRVARSHLQLPLGAGPMTSPLPDASHGSSGEQDAEFDFSKPLVPQKKVPRLSDESLDMRQTDRQSRRRGASSIPALRPDGDADVIPGDLVNTGTVASQCLDVLSPTDDTSNPEPSTWDADVESHAEESISETENSEMDGAHEPRRGVEVALIVTGNKGHG